MSVNSETLVARLRFRARFMREALPVSTRFINDRVINESSASSVAALLNEAAETLEEHQAVNAGATPAEKGATESAQSLCLSCRRLEQKRQSLYQSWLDADNARLLAVTELTTSCRRLEGERDELAQTTLVDMREGLARAVHIIMEIRAQLTTAHARIAALEGALRQIDALPSELAGDAWAIARSALAASPDPILKQNETVTCSLRAPDWVCHLPSQRCATQEPHHIDLCGEFDRLEASPNPIQNKDTP